MSRILPAVEIEQTFQEDVNEKQFAERAEVDGSEGNIAQF